MLTPHREARFETHAGPFLFEVQIHDLSPDEFYSRLDGCFNQLPKDFRYAAEIRNAGLIGPEYQKVLHAPRGCACLHFLVYMPSVAKQHQRMGRFTAFFAVLRLLAPLKIAYEAAKKRTAPYTTIVAELPAMRRETVELIRKAVAEGRQVYVLVNNRSEVPAPLTVQALTEMLSKT